MPKFILMLRWVLGIGCMAALGMFLLIFTAGKGFDAFRSGPSSENLVRDLLPIAIPLLLGTILASVIMPGAKVFQHFLAVAVILAFVSLIPVFLEHPGEGLIYLGFLGLWLLYYWLLMRKFTGMSTFGYVLGAAATPAVLWFGWDYWKMTHRPADTNLVTGLLGNVAEGVSGLMLGISIGVLALSGLLIWFGRTKG